MKPLFILGLGCLVIFNSTTLHAAELIWDADPLTPGAQNGNGTWNALTSNTNWWNGAANVTWNNATPDSAVFGNGGVIANTTVTVPGGTTNTVGGLTFNTPGVDGYTIAAGAISTSKLNLAGNPSITVVNGAAASLNIVLTGSALIKAGGGTLTLNPSANNIYSGGTLISAGILRVSSTAASGALGSGPITNNSVLVFDRATGTATISAVISGTGSLTNSGNGVVALNAVNTYLGDTTISAGAVNLDSDGTPGNGGTVRLSGGTLNTTSSRSVNANPVSNPIELTADSAITTSSSAASVDVNFTSDAIGGSAGTLTFRNDGADAAADEFEPRFSGSFTFNRPIVIADGAVGKTRLNSFNTNGTTQTFNGVISGNGAFRRSMGVGFGGVTVFNADNSYTGDTVINNGTLRVNGSLASGAITVSSGGVLGGNGVIKGSVSVQSGGVLSAGTSIGRLTISNSLTLSSGGTVVMELNRAAGTNDVIGGLSSVVYDGTLIVTNLAGTLTANDEFRLFAASAYSNAFDTIVLPTLGNGLSWDVSGLTNIGAIRVTGTGAPQPYVGTISLTPAGLVITGAGGTFGSNYCVLFTTNLTLPYVNWTPLGTNKFIAGGQFSCTNPVNPSVRQMFFIIRSP